MPSWVSDVVDALWAGFPVDAEPRSVVLLEPLTRVEGAFTGDQSKVARMNGAIEYGSLLPPSLETLLPPPNPDYEGPSVRVTQITSTAAVFRCDRGPRELPAYRLHVTGLQGSCVVLSPELRRWWPVDYSDVPRPASVDAAVDADGVTIHLPAFGGVLTEFHRAELEEHHAYVVGRAVTSERPAAPGTAIPLVGIHRKVTDRLQEPLGGRVLITPDGYPLSVTPTATSGNA